MNNQDIQHRLQNIINLDVLANKQMALKTKRLYKKLHFLANNSDITHQQLHDKMTQLIMAKKMLNEHHKVLSTLQDTKVKLQQQLARTKKKVFDLRNQATNQSHPGSISPNDRFVYTKNALKKSLLVECTKMRFHEAKGHNRVSLAGYVSGPDKLYPFQEKIAIESQQPDRSTLLWEHVKLGSSHLDEWDQLFSNESEHHTTF